jgi:MazG family protein
MQADSALGRVLDLVRLLRRRSEWPGAQTRETLRPYLLEEALELEQSIADSEPEAIRTEVGDVLLHVAFQIVIAEERSEFDAEAVVAGLERKMRRRHPHAFDDVPPPTSWERAKAEEQPTGSVLEGLPRTLPPLLAAFRLQERAAGVGFDWPDADGPMAKVREELNELGEARSAAAREEIAEELGDLLFAVVNLARKLGVAPTSALDLANRKFRDRFGAIERIARSRGLDLYAMSLDELDRLWNEVKATA